MHEERKGEREGVRRRNGEREGCDEGERERREVVIWRDMKGEEHAVTQIGMWECEKWERRVKVEGG